MTTRAKKWILRGFSTLNWSGINCLGYGYIMCVDQCIFQRAKLSTRSITHLCWCKWRTFWRKNAAGGSPRGSCSCTTKPRLTGHFQPRRYWPTLASSILITHPILRIWPRWTTICSMDWKKIERSPFFVRRGGHCCCGDLAGRTNLQFF